MICRRCGNEEAIHIQVKYEKGERREICDKCGGIGSGFIPDVYCAQGGYFDENLADSEHHKGQWVRDRFHKAELLKKLNLEEAGGQRNPETGKVTPYIADPEKRRRYCIDNFGGNG